MKDFNDVKLTQMLRNRPKFSSRAVVTAGMPYGNKELHFGHVGGVFVHADFYARFLKDKIGKDNVIFVSGTDCYGSPIVESHRKLVEGGRHISIEEFVRANYESQNETLQAYEVGLSEYLASAFGPAKNIHEELSNEIFQKLYAKGCLEKLSVLQFFDDEKQVFLNGRQVLGKCPFENCASEQAYADECSVGHQYMPSQLIDPISAVSGKKPTLKNVENWYFKLEDCTDLLNAYLDYMQKHTQVRPYILKEVKEFLKAPEIYIKNEFVEQFEHLKDLLPSFSIKETSNKSSTTYVFETLSERETACDILTKNEIRYRTGKTLVPFRLTGNCEWGVKADTIEGVEDQTFWVWPESLWAPISFTKAHLKKIGSDNDWKDWWCSKDCEIFQVIGEDNMYFYSPVQNAIWASLSDGERGSFGGEGRWQVSSLISNKHILFMNAKASSSGKIKPPMAKDLLNHYTAEQLRCHFLGLNLGNNSSSFNPKVYDKEDSSTAVDPVLKEGSLLTNVFNRTLRSLFYCWQKHFDGVIPVRVVDESMQKKAITHILNYEKRAYQHKFHMVMYEIDSLIRDINKYYVREIKIAEDDPEKMAQVVANTLYLAKVAMVLLHPIVPEGTEKMAKKLCLDDTVFDWSGIDKPFYDFFNSTTGKPEFLVEREDFFKKHPSQFVTSESE